MSKYIISHGSIAAVQYVTLPDGQKVTVAYVLDGSERELPYLPLEVQAAVNRQFEAIFIGSNWKRFQSFKPFGAGKEHIPQPTVSTKIKINI